MKYFAYGSNMDPEQIENRGITFTKREWAVLKGWRLKFNKIASRNPHREGYANIVEYNLGIVEGILYEISEEDIKKLDKYEGYPTHYDRISVDVVLENGMNVKAITYVAQLKKTKDGLKPTKKYLAHLLKGCDLLSPEYCKKTKDMGDIRLIKKMA